MWFLFADTDWTAWTVTILSLLGAGVAWLWFQLNAKRKDTIKEWQEAAAYEREQRYRAEARVANLEASFRRMFALYSEEHSGRADYYSIMTLQAAVVKRQNAKLEKAGLAAEDGLELPPKPERNKQVEAEFLMNTVAQEKIAADAVRQPPGGAP